MEILVLLGKTVLLRPYVFVFLAAFVFTSIVTVGRRRTLVFFLGTWLLAFLSEFSSTRNGFPYGLYHYTGSTRGEELYLSNVPFMDSLSYTFLLFASYSMALFSTAPLRVGRWDVQIVDFFEIRQSRKVLWLTALYMMMIDFVIDPAALQGERWFLGRIYYYDEAGAYFGVPLSNAIGWGVVGFSATWLYQTIERRWLGPSFRDRGILFFPLRGLFGPGLYYGVLAFILTVTAWIGERGLFIAGVFIFILPTALFLARLFDRRIRASDSEWEAYRRERGVAPIAA